MQQFAQFKLLMEEKKMLTLAEIIFLVEVAIFFSSFYKERPQPLLPC